MRYARLFVLVVLFLGLFSLSGSYASQTQKYSFTIPTSMSIIPYKMSDGRYLFLGYRVSNHNLYLYYYVCNSLDNSTCRLNATYSRYVDYNFNSLRGLTLLDQMKSCGDLYIIFGWGYSAGSYQYSYIWHISTLDNISTFQSGRLWSASVYQDYTYVSVKGGININNIRNSYCGAKLPFFFSAPIENNGYNMVMGLIYNNNGQVTLSTTTLSYHDSNLNAYGSCIVDNYYNNYYYCPYIRIDDNGGIYNYLIYGTNSITNIAFSEPATGGRVISGAYYDENTQKLKSAAFVWMGTGKNTGKYTINIMYCNRDLGTCNSGNAISKYELKMDKVGSLYPKSKVYFLNRYAFTFLYYYNNKYYIASCYYNAQNKQLKCTSSQTDTPQDLETTGYVYFDFNKKQYRELHATISNNKVYYWEDIYDTKITINNEMNGQPLAGKIEIFGDKYFSINNPVVGYLSKNSFSDGSVVKVYNDYVSRFYFYKNPLTAYLLNVSETPTVQVVFQIQPANSDIVFRIKKITNDGLITIHEQKPDATGKVTTYLAQNNVYYIYIEDSEGERVIGNYIASYATTETIYLLGSGSSEGGTSISLSVSKDDSINNVRIKTEYNVTQGYIRVTYDDTTNSTQYVELHIYNETNDEVFFANSSQQSVVFNFINATVNSTYYIKLYAKRNTTDVVFSDYIRFYESEGINIPVKKEVLNIMVLLFLVAIALLTPQAYRKQGIMLMTAIIVLFNVFGWLSLSYYVISLIVFIALLVVLVG